jgi:hypothetical protein
MSLPSYKPKSSLRDDKRFLRYKGGGKNKPTRSLTRFTHIRRFNKCPLKIPLMKIKLADQPKFANLLIFELTGVT